MRSPTIPDEYADALERADAGIRLALPQFAERVGIGPKPAPVPLMDPDIAESIGNCLASARQELFDAMKLADLAGDRVLHVDLGERIIGLDDLGAVLSERWAHA